MSSVIAWSPFWRILTSVGQSNLDIKASTAILNLDVSQIENSQSLFLRIMPRKPKILLGFQQQEIEFEENVSKSSGPSLGLVWQWNRRWTYNLEISLLNVTFFDGSATEEVNSEISTSYVIDRTQEVVLSYSKQLDTCNEIFELLAEDGN